MSKNQIVGTATAVKGSSDFFTCSTALDKLDDNIRNLYDTVDRLQTKLNPLLVDSDFPPSEVAIGSARSSLGQSLLTKSHGLEELNARINFLLDNFDF